MKRFSVGIFIGFLLCTVFSAPWMYQAWAVGSCSVFRTWNTGDSVTASDLNQSFTTAAVTNSTPQCLDDYSASVSQMQSTTDPYASGTESLATSTAGELERLRFMFKQIFGLSQWYRHDQAPSLGSLSGHLVTGAVHVGSIANDSYAARFPTITGPDHWTGLFFPHATAHLAITVRDANHAQGGVQGGIELFRFHANGLVLHHTVSLMFRHSLANNAATTHITALSIDRDTDALILGHHTATLRIRAANLHAGGQLQVGYGGHLTTTLGPGTARFDFTNSTTTTLNRGVIPLQVNGLWTLRTISSPVTLSNSGLAASTLYYIYAYDNSGILTLEASTTTWGSDPAYGVRVKSGDATRTLVGMLRTDGSGTFAAHASARLVASWFGQRPITAHATATTSLGATTTSTVYVSLSNDTEIEVLTWDTEVAVTAGGGDVANSGAGGFVFVAIARNNLGVIAPGGGGGQSVGAGNRFFFMAHGVFPVSEGYHKFFPVWRVNAGTGTLSGAAPEALTTRATILQ